MRLDNELSIFHHVKSGQGPKWSAVFVTGHPRFSIRCEDYSLQCSQELKTFLPWKLCSYEHMQPHIQPVWGALWVMTGSDELVSCQLERRIPNSTDTLLMGLWSHLLRSSKDKSHFYNYSPHNLSFRSIFASSCSGITITLENFPTHAR